MTGTRSPPECDPPPREEAHSHGQYPAQQECLVHVGAGAGNETFNQDNTHAILAEHEPDAAPGGSNEEVERPGYHSKALGDAEGDTDVGEPNDEVFEESVEDDAAAAQVSADKQHDDAEGSKEQDQLNE